MRPALVLLALSLLADPARAAGKPMTIDDLLAVKGVSDPRISPDGKHVVYVVSEIDRAKNKSNSDLWLIATSGGAPRRLTTAPGADREPRWSPDGKQIAFVSDRGGSPQVWLLPVDGGEARQLTKLPIDVAGPIWSPKGDRIAFTAEVYPGKSAEQTAAKDKEKAEAKSQVRVYDSLMIRHWASWEEGKLNHLFLAEATTGEARDLLAGKPHDIPTDRFNNGSADYDFSPDGREIAFTSEPLKDVAWSTNTDIWVVPTAGGEPKNLTEDNPGADAQPAYSPDGSRIAHLRQKRAGFESDRWELVYQRRNGRGINTADFHEDRPVQSFVWTEGRTASPTFANYQGAFAAVIDDHGELRIVSYTFADHGFDGHAWTSRLVTGGVNSGVQASRDGKQLVFLRGDAAHPAEIYHSQTEDRGRAHGMVTIQATEPKSLTHHNDDLVSKLDLTEAERFLFAGADGDRVFGWLIKPPGFDENKKYPVVLLIHGGPQGAWHDEWHGRWNYHLFAAPGYAVVAINPRGSTGYGQKFTDQISKDWTGKVYEDLFKGLDHALKTYPFLDGKRVAAAGGSYGGFMVNWIAGHPEQGRFKCLISHAGVFDLTSKYGTTEELWFPEWEFGGTPWEKPETYREQSPSTYIKGFHTPTLVIHGALDFRVPDAQGLGMFTALQRRGVPSRYVFFPDEGHWIAKPANRVAWWREVHAWLAKSLRPDAK